MHRAMGTKGGKCWGTFELKGKSHKFLKVIDKPNLEKAGVRAEKQLSLWGSHRKSGIPSHPVLLEQLEDQRFMQKVSINATGRETPASMGDWGSEERSCIRTRVLDGN